MSNNKQSIKVYTEEQVIKIALQVKDYGYWDNREFTHIELPSDEEIEEVADIVYGFNNNFETNVKEYKAFKHGAKYIINKIQGGNK